ncbi:MAG: hypothetical protein ACLFWM_05555 [Actinomycetota bacterium]
MNNDREILTAASERLKRALDRGTGTSLDAEEVNVLGRLLHAISSAALGTAQGREACAVCGQAEHRNQAVGSYPPHAYERGFLVPLSPPESPPAE